MKVLVVKFAILFGLFVAWGVVHADTFSPATAPLGGAVTLTGKALAKGMYYVDFSGGCVRSIGRVKTNSQGEYSLTFNIPACASPGPAYVSFRRHPTGSAYFRGRESQIGDYWSVGGLQVWLDDQQLVARKQATQAAQAAQQQETAIRGSYSEAFGRDPQQGEIQFWQGQGQLSQAQLVDRHRGYIKQDAATRRDIINRSYQAILKRAPNADEQGYWNNRVRQSGETYTEMVSAHRNWLAQNPQPNPSPAPPPVAQVPQPSPVTDRCFGAMGSNCTGLVKDANTNQLVPGRTNLPNGNYILWVSVGSIKHDLCCSKFKNGKMCGGALGASQAEIEAAKKMGPFDRGDGHCVAEWDKAWWDGLQGRAWSKEFNPNQVPGLDLVDRVPNPRQSTFNGTPLVDFETKDTRSLSAPSGQALDIGDRTFCASGQFRDERWCTAGGALCSSIGELNAARQYVKDYDIWWNKLDAINKTIQSAAGTAADRAARVANVVRLEGIYNTRHTHWGICQ